MSAAIQLDLFSAVAPVVSRWPGDGPYPSEVWRDDGATTIRRFFDGSGWCQCNCAPCRRCGLWHPLGFEWGPGGGDREEAYRCPGGAGWWQP